jgi:hypothetical protein
MRTQARMDADPNLTSKSFIKIGIAAWQAVREGASASRPQEQGLCSGLPVSDAELKELSPWYARMRAIFDDPADAAALVSIGRTACIHVGVSGRLFEQACARHGSTRAALAALAVLEKPAYQIRSRSRGAVLVGMFSKPPEALHPLASLYGYRAERRRNEAAARDGRCGHQALP